MNKEKTQAKTFEELLPLLVKEQQLAHKLAKESPAIFEKLAERQLNTDPQVIESLIREQSFLIKHNVVPEKNLFKTVQKSPGIATTAQDMFKECQSFAKAQLRRNVTMVKRNDELGREAESLQHMNNMQESAKHLNPYFDQEAKSTLKEHTNRLKVYEIAEEHSHKHPEQSQKFKEEMRSLSIFSTSYTLQLALDRYQEKGIVEATAFAEEKNSQYVISRLASRVNILRSDKSSHGKDYTEAVAKDSEIMRYVDKALSEGKRFDKPQPQDNNLLAYANQRDVNYIISTMKEPQAINKFKSKVEDILKYSNNENLKGAIEIFKDKGMNDFTTTSENICTKAVMGRIEQDIQTIRKGGVAQGFDEKNYRDKSEYLGSLNCNKNIMQYIDPKSDIGKEVGQAKQVSNDFGLER